MDTAVIERDMRRLEQRVEMYRRLYRAALELLKTARRRRKAQ
jgi:hypothetical protein